jgi:hypothetical protein
LPSPAFRMINAEPGGGEPSPYTLLNPFATKGQASCLPSRRAPTSGGPTLPGEGVASLPPKRRKALQPSGGLARQGDRSPAFLYDSSKPVHGQDGRIVWIIWNWGQKIAGSTFKMGGRSEASNSCS